MTLTTFHSAFQSLGLFISYHKQFQNLANCEGWGIWWSVGISSPALSSHCYLNSLSISFLSYQPYKTIRTSMVPLPLGRLPPTWAFCLKFKIEKWPEIRKSLKMSIHLAWFRLPWDFDSSSPGCFWNSQCLPTFLVLLLWSTVLYLKVEVYSVI